MYAADIADADRAIAFPSFRLLVAPALRAVTRTHLRRARHVGDVCSGPTEGTWCADCEETLHDVLLDSFNRLRRALAGDAPRTRDGTRVRELITIVDHLRSDAARYQDVTKLAPLLLQAPVDGEPSWLRAVRAQLVHYPVRHLEERVRRADAVRLGGSARPDRDLRQASWAAPLRADPLTLDLLLAFIGRLRHRADDPYAMPVDLLLRHGIEATTAARRLDAALNQLRDVRPQFYADNVTAQLPPVGLPDGVEIAQIGPEEQMLAAERRQTAHAVLTRLAQGPRAYRSVLAEVCAAGSGPDADPVARTQRELGLTPVAAHRFVRRLAQLAGAAGLVD